MTKRICKTCGEEKDLETEFSLNGPKRKGYKLSCKECRNSYARNYMQSHPEAREYRNRYSKNYREIAKLRVLIAYGGECVCCGETEPKFLTLDHVNSDGAEHKRSLAVNSRSVSGDKIYKWAIDNNYPETLQIMCYNCNCGKHRNGGVLCPHISNTLEEIKLGRKITVMDYKDQLESIYGVLE